MTSNPDISCNPSAHPPAARRRLLRAGEILELGAQWALKSEDIAAFERYISQLKPYYFDFNNDSIPESPFM